MPQTGALEEKLRRDARQPRPQPLFATKTVYRLYTENTWVAGSPIAVLTALVKRYFDGATIYGSAIGLDSATIASDEPAFVIEVVSSLPDADQRIAFLAGDIRETLKQVSVLVTRQTVDTFEANADSTR